MVTDFVKRAFIIIFSAVTFFVLFWFFFGNPFHTLNPSYSAKTLANYSEAKDSWMGALYYVCENMEKPIASHYYTNVYIPNVHTYDGIDAELAELSHGTLTTRGTLSGNNADFRGTATDLSSDDNSELSTTTDYTYTTGWK